MSAKDTGLFHPLLFGSGSRHRGWTPRMRLSRRNAELVDANARLELRASAAEARAVELTNRLAQKERLATLGSLAASIAHNVRNPLSALIAGLPTVRRRMNNADQLDGTTGELMDLMVDCAERIERMTHDLLDLSRIDRDASAPFTPGSGLLACTRLFGARFTAAAVTLDTAVDELSVTYGRASDLTLVFMNVIDNALRAVEGKGRIEVRGVVVAGEYVVSVGDSGPGIDPAVLDRVFEPFWTTRPAGEGTGLGLAIARQLVADHGGTIEAGRSALGGAEFTIRLPLRQAQPVA